MVVLFFSLPVPTTARGGCDLGFIFRSVVKILCDEKH